MTEIFKGFVVDVNALLEDDELGIFSTVDEEYNIVVNYHNETIVIPTDMLYKYYEVYTFGRKSYSSTVLRANALIRKNILGIE